MNRKRSLLFNSGSGMLKQLVTVICGFILPRYMLMYYGSSVNGLVSSVSHYLGFISLLELGIGPVIQANLYKPLAEKDDIQISKIVISSERFFRRIAFILVGYILVLVFVFPRYICQSYDTWFTASLIIIIAISTFAQYYFGATYQLLLNAAQRSYIQLNLQTITIILNTIFCIILIKIGVSVHVVKLTTALLFFIRPICQSIYVKKHYQINKEIQLEEEPIKQKWNGFAQHLAGTVCSGTDVMVLTLFSTLENVSVYTVYYNVTIGVTNLIITVATGIDAVFGDMIAKGEQQRLKEMFRKIETITHFVVTVVFTVTAITIVPFIKVYTRGVNDSNYILPVFGCAIVFAYGMQAIRVPYARIINAAGKFKETQKGALISAALNVVLTVALVYKIGLVGAAVGTFVAMFYHVVYFVVYLKKNIIYRSVWTFAKMCLIDVVIVVVSYLLCCTIVMGEVTYTSWAFMAAKVTAIVFGVALAVNAVLQPKMIQHICGDLKNRLVRK